MYEKLIQINSKPKPFEFYTAEKLWNDEYISKKMLEFHLTKDIDLASRNENTISDVITWITNHFKINKNKKICDFGCGPGLYTIKLAEIGANVTGIDFSIRSINYAKKQAEKENLKIDYIFQNYLEYNSNEKFDLITMIFCDFCALSPDQRKILLKIFYKNLNNNGSLFLDVCSLKAFNDREEVIKYEHQLLNNFWSKNDYFGFLNTFKYNNEKVILDKYTIIEKSKTWEVFNWLQYYSLETIKKEFIENGFNITEHYADLTGKKYTSDSNEIAIIAEKI